MSMDEGLKRGDLKTVYKATITGKGLDALARELEGAYTVTKSRNPDGSTSALTVDEYNISLQHTVMGFAGIWGYFMERKITLGSRRLVPVE